MEDLHKSEEEWKERLTPEQYAILRERGTEAPFSGKFLQEKRGGTYQCAACGSPLFSSETKFDSGTGWPSFDEALPGAVTLRPDDREGVHRIEAVCTHCGSHLGHLFEDGPTTSGKRYCINSVCLDLESKEKTVEK